MDSEISTPASETTSVGRQGRVCYRCASIKQACDGCLPCGRCARLSLPCCDKDSVPETERCVPRIKRVHTGCEACKTRKRKCDEAKPRCRSCVRLCLDCVWPQEWRKKRRRGSNTSSVPSSPTALAFTPLTINADASSSEWTSCEFTSMTMPSSDQGQETAIMTVPRPPSVAPELDCQVERGLLGHFISITAAHLTRAKCYATNPYLRYLLPIAFSERAVMDAILAISSSQQEKRKITSTQTTLRHQSLATNRLRELLSQFDSSTNVVALAASLTLCMTELYAGSTSGWKQHLQGSKQILDAMRTCTKTEKNDELRFLKHLYCFLDSATTISTCRPPLADRIEDEQQPTDSDLSIYGVPRSLFHLLDRVNSLAYQRRTRVDEESERAFRHTAQSVAEAIDFYANESDAETTVEAIHTSSAFKWAMRLRLAQIVDGYDVANPEIISALEAILHEVQQVPATSPSQVTLLFPLIMAAGACVEEGDRSIIRERLNSMKDQTGFGYIYSAHDLAEQVWIHRDLEAFLPSSSPVNWAHIRYYDMHGLAIF